MKVWRVAKLIHSPSGAAAFSGAGGMLVDGRWHTRGRPVVYAARSEALAKLEALVHFKPVIHPSVPPIRLVLIEAAIPDSSVARLGQPPRGWDDVPDSGSARAVGDAWLQAGSSLALEVPSIHSRSERNLLLNPLHPDFRAASIGAPVPFTFDDRLNDPTLR